MKSIYKNTNNDTSAPGSITKNTLQFILLELSELYSSGNKIDNKGTVLFISRVYFVLIQLRIELRTMLIRKC